MPSTFHHHWPPPDAVPATSRPSSAGRKRSTSRIGCTSSIIGSSRCHSRLSTSGSPYGLTCGLTGCCSCCCWAGLVGCRGHVASPGIASALRVSSSTRLRARSRSRPAISSAPAAEAVVAVTDAEAEQPRDGALDVVDRLDPRHRRDPPLAPPPPGLRVHRGVGDLPAMHGVPPLRDRHRRDERDDAEDDRHPPLQVVPVEHQRADEQRRHQEDGPEQATDQPHQPGPRADPLARVAQSRGRLHAAEPTVAAGAPRDVRLRRRPTRGRTPRSRSAPCSP